jgi:hypothetical protein
MNEPQPACYTAETILRDGYLLAVKYDAPAETQERLAAAHRTVVNGREEPHRIQHTEGALCGNESLSLSNVT